jgi:quercetin dioxygenase-like cupin family protein
MSPEPQPAVPLESLRAFAEGYPQGGRIARHSHDMDQLALISGSAAVIETDAVYVVHPLLKALWLPAGIEHSVYSPRPFNLHALYFPPNTIMARAEPQVLGLENLGRELVLFLCTAPRPSQRDTRHALALALLEKFADWRITSRASQTTDARWRSSPPKSAGPACGRSSACSSTRRG